MATQDIAAALKRFGEVMRQRPSMAIGDDPPATTRWEGGLRFAATHANGKQVQSDMAVELGGTGDQVSPGWLFRAGLASCTATVIAMTAAIEGIELDSLELEVRSRSDSRPVLGISDADGAMIFPGAFDMEMVVRAAARGVAPDALRDLIERACSRSPSGAAIEAATPLRLRIEIEAA